MSQLGQHTSTLAAFIILCVNYPIITTDSAVCKS